MISEELEHEFFSYALFVYIRLSFWMVETDSFSHILKTLDIIKGVRSVKGIVSVLYISE